MQAPLNQIPHRYHQTCECCGRRIQWLADRLELSLFLEEKSLRRRAFQCMNCGQVICSDCRSEGACCVCRGNAWVARPYLDLSVIRSV